MSKKLTGWKTKGMNRDLSVSAFNPEFAFENRNLRLSTNESNTLMSWVNEKGTKEITVEIKSALDDSVLGNTIEGFVLGTAILNHQLVVFTHQDSVDIIYVFTRRTPTLFAGIELYRGNLNLDLEHPLETLVSYESDQVQKVYWTDGKNQPRVINIAADSTTVARWRTQQTGTATCFDFVPALSGGTLEVEKRQQAEGLFAPGVIQYCFSYINKYGQQSNMVSCSPLFYLAHSERGASAEEKVNGSFKIKVSELDSNFDAIRLYSIQRTSLNTDPIVKHLADLDITDAESGALTYIDNGTTGSMMDPTELLFIGGKEITALTMADKDGTLFLGNITQKNSSVSALQTYFKNYPDSYNLHFDRDSKAESDQSAYIEYYKTQVVKTLFIPNGEGVYSYTSNLDKSSMQITSFKGGEWYRFGIQLQKDTGEWSDPIYLKDLRNSLYPQVDIQKGIVNLPYATATIDFNVIRANTNFDFSKYKKVRPVVVFPNIGDREVLCQGVLNPTVFNVVDRIDNSPYAQASWYFRPYMQQEIERSGTENRTNKEGNLVGTSLPFKHYQSLVCDNPQSPAQEIQNAHSVYTSPFDTTSVNGRPVVGGSRSNPTSGTSTYGRENTSNSQFFIDQSIVTLNSPDIDFDTMVQTYGTDNLHLRIIGAIPVTANVSSHSITASTMLEGWLGLDDSFKSDNITLTKPQDNVFGKGELKLNVKYSNFYSINSKYYAGHRLIADYLWNDVHVVVDGKDKEVITSPSFFDYMVYPWQRTGPLNNDSRGKDEASSWLQNKVEANLLYSASTSYFGGVDYYNINTQIHLTENAEVFNYRLSKQKNTSSDINYYPNIDKVLYTETPYSIQYYGNNGSVTVADLLAEIVAKSLPTSDSFKDLVDKVKKEVKKKFTGVTAKSTLPVSMKYKSTSHAVIALKPQGGSPDIPILPMSSDGVGRYVNASNPTTFWGDSRMTFSQSSINVSSAFENKQYNFLWLGELYKDSSENRFGGTSEGALKANTWLVGGEAKPITSNVVLNWLYGDTYFQRYDCLKTYPFTEDDTNQLVEILSFMCETHVNLDGRYDRNRGQMDNTNMSPKNFNLLNDVYTQQDNFFVGKIATDSNHKGADTTYPNYITYSKTKQAGADTDMWTNITLASVLELDGDKGELNALERFNDQILAFQDTGISQVMYNENVQIASTAGVPIEIANSGKVQGKRYISNTTGCSNKWSIVSAPSGLYFMDSKNKNIMLFNGQLNNLSSNQGFSTWSKVNIPRQDVKWNPKFFDNFVGYYDALNQDILFIGEDDALAYSEKLGTFTSFYDYGDTPYFCNFEDEGVWLKHRAEKTTSIWQHQGGEYCQFFGKNKPYWTILVGNPEPQTDKIFTNLEFRACVDGEGENVPVIQSQTKPTRYQPYLPFDYLEVWNEYQHGAAKLENKYGYDAMRHFMSDGSAALKRKFRMWRCDIPRDGAGSDKFSVFDYTFDYTFHNQQRVRGIDRMRNPWIYLKLRKEKAEDGKALPRAEIHDLLMTYYS